LTAGRITEVLELTKDRIGKAPDEELENIMVIEMANRDKFERKMFELILDYISSLNDGQKLFAYTRQWGWKTLKKYGFNPHFLRHIRLTHLVTVKNFTDQKLVVYAGWTDSTPAKAYMEMSYRDLI